MRGVPAGILTRQGLLRGVGFQYHRHSTFDRRHPR